jgi:hypothetical protein
VPTVAELAERVAALESKLAAVSAELDGVPSIRLNRSDAKARELAADRRRRANDVATDWIAMTPAERALLWPMVSDQIALVDRVPSLEHMLSLHQRAERRYRAEGERPWVVLSAGRTEGMLHLLRRSGQIELSDGQIKKLLKAGLPKSYLPDGLMLISFGSAHETYALPESALAVVRSIDATLDAEIRAGHVVVSALAPAEARRLSIAQIVRDLGAT